MYGEGDQTIQTSRIQSDEKMRGREAVSGVFAWIAAAEASVCLPATTELVRTVSATRRLLVIDLQPGKKPCSFGVGWLQRAADSKFSETTARWQKVGGQPAISRAKWRVHIPLACWIQSRSNAVDKAVLSGTLHMACSFYPSYTCGVCCPLRRPSGVGILPRWATAFVSPLFQQ